MSGRDLTNPTSKLELVELESNELKFRTQEMYFDSDIFFSIEKCSI